MLIVNQTQQESHFSSIDQQVHQNTSNDTQILRNVSQGVYCDIKLISIEVQ